MNEIVLLCKELGALITATTTINVFSLLLGMVLASLFEVPLISRLRR